MVDIRVLYKFSVLQYGLFLQPLDFSFNKTNKNELKDEISKQRIFYRAGKMHSFGDSIIDNL